MKKIIPVLFVVMILATACPQPEPVVHQVEIGLFTPYAIMPEIINGKVKEIIERNYLGIEEEGQVLKGERLTVGARDSIKWTSDFRLTFDEDGNLLESVTIDENDELVDKLSLTVEEGKIVKGHFVEDDTLRSYLAISYTDAGQIMKVEQYRMPVDTLTWGLNFLADEQGNLKEWQFMNPKGDPTSNYIFSVDQEGKRTGFKFYNKEGEVTFEQRFTYNDMGFLSKQLMINKEGEESVSEYEYAYDDLNNWVKVTGNSDQYLIVTERNYAYYSEQ